MLSSAQRSYINHLVSAEYDTKQGLKPPMSDRQFAETIKVHYNTLTNWKKLPEFQERLRLAKDEFEKGKDFFAIVMRQRANEALMEQYEKATGSDKRHYLQMIINETKKVDDYQEIEPYQDYTTEQLAKIAFERHVKVADIDMEELKKIAEGAA